METSYESRAADFGCYKDEMLQQVIEGQMTAAEFVGYSVDILGWSGDPPSNLTAYMEHLKVMKSDSIINFDTYINLCTKLRADPNIPGALNDCYTSLEHLDCYRCSFILRSRWSIVPHSPS